MEIPAEHGATGAILGSMTGTIGHLPTYEDLLKVKYEESFGPIPSGLAFAEVNKAFQGPSPFGISSVGVYPVPPPPEPPPLSPAGEKYLKKVTKAGAKQRRDKERARKAQIKTMTTAMLAAIDGLEVELDGPGKVVDHDWHGYVVTIRGQDIEAAILAAAEKRMPKNLRKDASLGWLEDVPLGHVTITVKFHGKDPA